VPPYPLPVLQRLPPLRTVHATLSLDWLVVVAYLQELETRGPSTEVVILSSATFEERKVGTEEDWVGNGVGGRGNKGGLEHGHFMIGVQGKGTLIEHAGRKVAHDRFGLDMKIAEHSVRAPATDKANDILADLGT
jgi:hypothetical protein